MVEGAYSVFPGQQRPKCISFTLDSPIQNRGLCVLHGSGKMGHVLNGVISHLGGICFKRMYGLGCLFCFPWTVQVQMFHLYSRFTYTE